MLQATGYPAEIADFYSAIPAQLDTEGFGCQDSAGSYVWWGKQSHQRSPHNR